jgi:hypothetical protein
LLQHYWQYDASSLPVLLLATIVTTLLAVRRQ